MEWISNLIFEFNDAQILFGLFQGSKKPPHMEVPKSWGWLYPRCAVPLYLFFIAGSHADDLMYIFHLNLPVVLCDLQTFLVNLSAAWLKCVTDVGLTEAAKCVTGNRNFRPLKICPLENWSPEYFPTHKTFLPHFSPYPTVLFTGWSICGTKE